MTSPPFPERYEPSRPLGQGGGGEVWQARDRVTGGAVALKILRSLSGSAELEALIRETTTLSGLEGLGFPRVLELGRTVDGRLYLVRELVDGESWEALGERDPSRLVSLLPLVADVLTVVHRTGLLHGDVKPANVIVRRSGSVALVDLGLATALREGGNPALGLTPHYAAPEVLAGGPLTVQAEIYSLGVILADGLERAVGFAPAAAGQLREIAARARADDPRARFPSADEFGSAVRVALGGDVPPSEAAPVPWPVLGLDALAYRLRKGIDELPPGERLELWGPPGSGRSTLIRRVAWALALEGRRVALVDAELAQSELLTEVLAGAANERGVVFVDAPLALTTPSLESARRAGARFVVTREETDASAREQALSSSAAALSPGAAARIEVPPLDESTVRRLLRGALPGLPSALVGHVVELVGARPLSLRRFVDAAEGRPIVSREDLDAVVRGEIEEDGDPARAAEKKLDRGHYAAARPLLDRLSLEDPHAVWLEARYQVAAGTAARALELTEAALAREPAGALRQRLETSRARALLGVGRYQDALTALASLEQFEGAIRTEALAYRGLAETLLGRHESAVVTQTEAERQALELGVERLVALASSCRGTAEWRLGRLADATASYDRAIAASSRSGDSGMLASAQINLAGLKKEQGDLAASMTLLEGALDAASRAGRKASLQQALLNLTNADLYLGRLERARAEIERIGDPEGLPPALRAQLHGLRAELWARALELERALPEYEACARAFEELGRRRDASEAHLEAVLVASHGAGASGRASEVFVASAELLRERLDKGRELLSGEVTPLLRLAEARYADFRGEPERAEELAKEAARLAKEADQKEWAWRALALEAELVEAAGKRTRAQRARAEAIEILEEIGARLPPDLREVYWNDERRRALRADGEPHSSPLTAHPTEPRAAASSGTDAVSRLTQTPLERRLARILAINSDLASEIDLDRLATKIVGHAAELLGAERGYLLLGSSVDTLEVRASRSAQRGSQLAFSRSVAQEVLRSGRPLVSIDAGHDKRLRAFESVHAASVTAVACVPVLSPAGLPIGVLYLETRRGARPDFGEELPMLQAFADQAAIALESARLVAELAKKSAALEERNQRLTEAQLRLKELLGRRTARLKEVRQELRGVRDKLKGGDFFGLVGTSAVMRRIYALIERVQETDVPVLITGESGTGKEVVARAIHDGSLRRKEKMLAVNCGAIPETILESELFGHRRGAFTGADRDRKGLFVEAERGTLFLDEIGETPLKMQAGLLRVLQEHRVRAVGGVEEVPVDVRVIFATNRDLNEAVRRGTFREDLLYRIQVVEIALPPLRERREDIPLLVDHFLGRFAARFGQEKKALSRDAITRLVEHPLPGNVRQLENTLLNAWVLSDGAQIEAEDIALPGRESEGRAPSRPGAPPAPAERPHVGSTVHSTPHARPTPRGTWSEHQKNERARIVEALERTGWNRVRAAEVLGMPRRTFYRRLREYGIQ